MITSEQCRLLFRGRRLKVCAKLQISEHISELPGHINRTFEQKRRVFKQDQSI